MVQNKKELVSLLQSQRDRIQNLGVKRLGLFGSFARGEQNRESDVDILVEFEKGQKNFDHLIHLAFFRRPVQTPCGIGDAGVLEPLPETPHYSRRRICPLRLLNICGIFQTS